MAFPGGSAVKNLPVNAAEAGNVSLTPGSGRAPGGENGNLLQYSRLGNFMNRGIGRATVHGIPMGQICINKILQWQSVKTTVSL